MGKDPAVLFYTSDFLSGTYGMTMDERGQYITLLCLQHLQGHLSEKIIRLSVGDISSDVRAKFVIDEQGLLFNPRMDEEKEKRAAFVTARVLNGQKGGRPPKSKESENLNETDRFLVGKAKGNLAENENIYTSDNSSTSRDREIVKGEREEEEAQIEEYIREKVKEEGFEGEDADAYREELREKMKLKYMGGALGEGILFMSEEQFDDLCVKLSLDELHKYCEIIKECETNGKRFWKKSHYQAILDMANKDRRINK